MTRNIKGWKWASLLLTSEKILASPETCDQGSEADRLAGSPPAPEGLMGLQVGHSWWGSAVSLGKSNWLRVSQLPLYTLHLHPSPQPHLEMCLYSLLHNLCMLSSCHCCFVWLLAEGLGYLRVASEYLEFLILLSVGMTGVCSPCVTWCWGSSPGLCRF